MRVGVDARSVMAGRGVTRYTIELLRALVRGFPDDRFVLFVPGRGSVPALADIRAAANVSLHRHPLPSRVLFGSAAVLRRPRLERLLGEAVDVVWLPAPVPVAMSSRVPYALTVHDLSFVHRPEDFTAYERAWHRLMRPRALATAARRVIVPVPAVGAEITDRWGVDPQRTAVVPYGVRLPDHPADPAPTLESHGLSAGGYLLVVGALEPRKAPDVVVRAFQSARARGLDAELVFAGAGRLSAELAAPGVRLLGAIDDAELDALYRGALALVSASRLEGFGLTVYEALARGTPAVITDLPVFGDELSPAVLRVPVDDAPALSDALLQIAGDAGLREQLGAAAPRTVEGVTWERAARRIRDVLAQT